MPDTRQILKIDGRQIPVSNLDKVLYPAAGFTKRQVIDYYRQVSSYILPHLKDRPVTLKRFPDGVDGEFFYEKNAPSFTPEWVQTFSVPRRGGPDIRYILINDLATLVWVANLASLELHPFLHRVPHLQQPTEVVFDLDPGEGSDILTCAEAAFLVQELLAGLGLKCFPKVSGSKGIQIYVPLNTAADYKITRPFAKAVADLLSQKHPNLIVSNMAKKVRTGRILIDWSQNSDSKTTVAVYSLRARHAPPFVSGPVGWHELESAAKSKNAAKLYFEADQALGRFERLGDLFAPVLRLKQHLPEAVLQWGARTGKSKPAASLAPYRSKRDFRKTPEPDSKLSRRTKQGGTRRFAVQKHAASHLHYDFRLEMDGVLKSWAVPKGPPYDLSAKRLAVAVEDHPLAYLDFEGIIPKGQYGGGTVMVWDIGTYELMGGNYFKGFLHVFLKGHKLKGEWTLARSREKPGNKWYMIKVGADMLPVSSRRDDQSALTRRTMAQIANDADAVWQGRGDGTVTRRARAAL